MMFWKKGRTAIASLIITVLLSLLITSCSKTPDVRLTLCQDLTQLLLKTSHTLEWQEHSPIINGQDDLEMKIMFALIDGNGQRSDAQASCFYQYEQDEIGAETFNTPTSAYSTYPNKMLLQGKVIDKQRLINSINQAMMKQGKEAINKAKEGIEKASQKVSETL